MRVLYLDDIPTPYRLGVFKEIQKADNLVFRILFCASSEPGRSWNLDFTGLDVETLQGYQWRPSGQMNPFSFKWNPSIARKLAEFKPDVVMMSGYVHPTMQRAASWCRKHGIPYGLSCESSFLESRPEGWRWKLKKMLFGKTISKMAFGLPTGKKAEQYLRALGAEQQPMFYFPNTPDIRPILEVANEVKFGDSRQQVLEKLGLPYDKKIVLFVGRLIQAKRPLDLLNAFNKLPNDLAQDCILVFVGDGVLNVDINKAASEHQNIYSLGWIGEPEIIYSLMAISSLFVLPSEHEPWGAVINEAMAAGLPVIASDKVGAAHEMVCEGENGYLVPVGDVSKFKSRMELLLSNESDLMKFGIDAQSASKNNDHRYAAKNIIAAIKSSGNTNIG